MKFKKFSISPKLFITSFIPLALVGIISIFSFTMVTRTIIDGNVKMMSAGFLSYTSSKIKAVFSDDMAYLNFISTIIVDTNQNKKIISDNLKYASSNNSNVLAYYYVTTESLKDDGFLVMSDDWNAPDSFNQYDRPWYKDAINSNGMFVYNSYLNTRVNKYCIAISKAVISKTGKVLGVVGFDISLESLSGIVNEMKMAEGSSVYIIEQDGTYIACKDSTAVKERNYFVDSSIGVDGKAPEDFYGKYAKTIIKGGKYYGNIKIGDTPWFVVSEGDTSVFTKYFVKNVAIIAVVIAFVCFAATLFILHVLEKNRAKEKALGTKLYAETQNLVVAAKENAATSQDQSAAVKEIVATMEDNNELSENISVKIKDVASVANKTSNNVTEGVTALASNVQKLHEIFDANQHTIDGIKSLGEKIENIWDIVTLINSVADQAKIIAFNAELEASSAGEAGKNFHIVATEIRRLADGIIDGTKEIKERINEIQQSSDSLILASESGTEKINEGCENAKELEEKFESIKNASEITAGSANDITSIIQQQTVASEQILITLKQIAAGVENFTQATESISSASQNVQIIAEHLNNDDNQLKGNA